MKNIKLNDTQILALQLTGLDSQKIEILKNNNINSELIKTLESLKFEETALNFLKDLLESKEKSVNKIEVKIEDKKEEKGDNESLIPEFEDFHIAFLKNFKKSNRLSESQILGFDYISSKFFYHNEKTDEIKFFEGSKDDIKKYLCDYADLDPDCLSPKFVGKIRLYIKGYKVVYNPFEGGIYEEYGEKFYNTYRPTNVLKMAKTLEKQKIENKNWKDVFKNCPAFELLFQNLTNQDDKALEYFINWIAGSFHSKLPTTVLLHGAQGTGKDLLFQNLFLKIYGKANTAQISNKQLRDNFNSWAENKMFVLANEVKQDFKKDDGLTNELKELITNDSINVNIKFGRQYVAMNFFNMMFFSNLDVPLSLEEGDRRFTIIRTSDTPIKKIVESLGMTIEDYIERLEKEFTKFFLNLYNFDFDKKMIKWTLDTDSKRTITETTVSNIEKICARIKAGDIAYIDMKLEEISEGRNDMAGYKNIVESLEAEREHGRVKMSDMFYLYKYLVDEENNNKNKISTIIGKYLGEKKTMRDVNGKHCVMRLVSSRDLDLSILKLDFSVKQEENEVITESDKAIVKNIIKTEEERINLDKEDLLNLIENNSFDLEDLSANSLCVKIDNKIYCTENLSDEETDKFISILSK